MRVDIDLEGNWTWFYFSEKPNDAVIEQMRALKRAHGGKYTTKKTRCAKYDTDGAWYIRTWVKSDRTDGIMALQGLVMEGVPFDPEPGTEEKRGRIHLSWAYDEPGPLEKRTKPDKTIDTVAFAKATSTPQIEHGVTFVNHPIMPSDVKNQTDAYLAYVVKLHQDNRPKTGAEAKREVYKYVPSWIKPVLPGLYDTQNVDDPVIILKWFALGSSWTWYVLEVDQETNEVFCLKDGHDAELGYSNLDELSELHTSSLKMPIERDLHWMPVRLSTIMNKVEGNWHLPTPELETIAVVDLDVNPEEVSQFISAEPVPVPAYTITDSMGTVLKDTSIPEPEVLTRTEALDILDETLTLAKANNPNQTLTVDVLDAHERVLAAEIVEDPETDDEIRKAIAEAGTVQWPEPESPAWTEPALSPTEEAYDDLSLWFEGSIKQCKHGISKTDNVAVLEHAAQQPLVSRYPEKVKLIERKAKKLRKEAA